MKKINKIPLVVLSTFGHCGVDWLHSLIDSHKEILILPPLSFFRRIDHLKKKGIYLDNTLSIDKVANIFTKELFKKTKIDSYNMLKRSQTQSVFKKHIKDYLLVENELDIEKKVFYAIHYAFAKINKINLNKIKTIVTHEHVSWNCYLYNKFFNSKFLFIIREPKKVVAGSIRFNKRYKDIPINYQFDGDLLWMLSANKFIKKLKKKNYFIIKNEDMHKNLKSEMVKLSKWLNIKYSKSLLTETFLGKKWLGESAYLSKVDLKVPYPKDYYKPENIEKRWRSILNKKSILVVETVFEKIMIKYKYKFDNKLNSRKRLNGYINLLFGFNEKNNFFYRTKGLIKNIIRRILIIVFTKESAKIFDL